MASKTTQRLTELQTTQALKPFAEQKLRDLDTAKSYELAREIELVGRLHFFRQPPYLLPAFTKLNKIARQGRGNMSDSVERALEQALALLHPQMEIYHLDELQDLELFGHLKSEVYGAVDSIYGKNDAYGMVVKQAMNVLSKPVYGGNLERAKERGQIYVLIRNAPYIFDRPVIRQQMLTLLKQHLSREQQRPTEPHHKQWIEAAIEALKENHNEE